jgi:hypothetical protein
MVFVSSFKMLLAAKAVTALKTAPAALQRVMDFEPTNNGFKDCAVCSRDHLVVDSYTPKDHIHDVARTVDMLSSCGLKACPDKPICVADQAKYLGEMIQAHDSSPRPAYAPSSAGSGCRPLQHCSFAEPGQLRPPPLVSGAIFPAVSSLAVSNVCSFAAHAELVQLRRQPPF